MFVKDLRDCEEFEAGDSSILRELLHPDKANLALGYSLAWGTLKLGESSKPHKLRASEVYYILEGEGTMHIDDESSRVHCGQAIYVPPNSKQYIQNRGNSDLKFLCIVDPAWRAQEEEIL